MTQPGDRPTPLLVDADADTCGLCVSSAAFVIACIKCEVGAPLCSDHAMQMLLPDVTAFCDNCTGLMQIYPMVAPTAS